MSLFRAGSLWLFRLAGIDVYVHWTWLLVAFLQVQARAGAAEDGNPFMPLYHSGAWHALQYVALFGIVLVHEFGHALACRQVGGWADTIVLWPLGGIAFVKPPPRPGALLWTAAAGPLVNVALVPLFGAVLFLVNQFEGNVLNSDCYLFLRATFLVNLVLLIFNLIPVYPLDGGQILQAALWFLIGRADSLLVVSILGMIVGGCVMLLSFLGSFFLLILSAFVLLTATAGFRHGLMLSRLLRAPHHKDAACPSCGFSPPAGNYWTCDECGTRFDTFHCRAQCPGCGKLFRTTMCPECFQRHPIGEWFSAVKGPEDSHSYAPP
jgi:Zn-dependent protease